MNGKPNLKFDHAYAIIRIEEYIKECIEISNGLHIVKVLFDLEDADKEVQRLNVVNKDKKCKYYWQCVRIERKTHNGICP